ncbi:MAG: ferrous iron transport protein B [Phycisphaerae bacterium]
MKSAKKITVALIGNPNSGKTTIFNMLTGARQHVGNYPGVTVEKFQGVCRYKDFEMHIVDLPGTYSLTAYSPEELIARNYIIDEHPDVVVQVVDASHIERSLYLTMQLIEIDAPLVLAFNMSDIARQKGLVFDTDKLSTLLEAPIVQTVGSKNKGKQELLDMAASVSQKPKTRRIHTVTYGDEIQRQLEVIEDLLKSKEPQLSEKYTAHWLAVKLLENDTEIAAKISDKSVHDTVNSAVAHLKSLFKDEPEIILADRRYGFISGACQETIKTTAEARHNLSDTIDTFVIHRILGLPIFLILMYIVFSLTFRLGKYPMDWLESSFAWLGTAIGDVWPADSMLWLQSLLVDGVIAGVGGVIVFLPNILLLFLAIAFLEDTGYMARAAFVADRIMHKIGLHGKSFIPMLIGFGCSVPAIMAARILENKRNRLTTIMVIPLMSCGAKLTIYMLIIPAFFVDTILLDAGIITIRTQALMLWLIYLIGIVIAVICAKLLRGTLFKGESIPFVMELPPYRMPTLKSLTIHMWQRAWLYLKKAGTIILAISIILWFAASYPRVSADSLEDLPVEQAQQTQLEYSVIGRFGKFIEPLIKPLGFDWKIGTALIGATAAKEVFVSQMGIIYAVGDTSTDTHTLRSTLKNTYTPLTGFCIMLFCLIYAPCFATLAATRMETNTWRWPIFQFFALTLIAYFLTLLTYQFGRLLL